MALVEAPRLGRFFVMVPSLEPETLSSRIAVCPSEIGPVLGGPHLNRRHGDRAPALRRLRAHVNAHR